MDATLTGPEINRVRRVIRGAAETLGLPKTAVASDMGRHVQLSMAMSNVTSALLLSHRVEISDDPDVDPEWAIAAGLAELESRAVVPPGTAAEAREIFYVIGPYPEQRLSQRLERSKALSDQLLPLLGTVAPDEVATFRTAMRLLGDQIQLV